MDRNRKTMTSLYIVGVIIIAVFSYQLGKSSVNNTDTKQPVGSNSTIDSATQPDEDDKFETMSLSGVGKKATENFFLPSGLLRFTLHHEGSSNFSVKLLNSDGEFIELLVNDIGDFDGSTAVAIDEEGEYLLNVEADGDWKIDIVK